VNIDWTNFTPWASRAGGLLMLFGLFERLPHARRRQAT
jgi:hypothetical protein